ncbi:MAG: hypothetical protein ABI778_00320 [Ignavibacteriota bacterium]
MALKKSTRWGLLIALLLGIGAGMYAYSEYNRTNANLADVKADIIVSAKDLYKEYSQNEKGANAKYFDKVTNVEGTVKSVEKDQSGTLTLMLDSGDPSCNISCQVDKRNASDASGLKVGDTVVVTGTCSGKGEVIMDIPSDILFTRCAVKKK